MVLPMLNAAPGLSCRTPEGAFYAYPNCSRVLGLKTPEGKTIVNEQDFALYMLDNGVAGIQGEAYGLSPYVRLSIATDLASLREACQRIQRACAALS